MGESPDRPPNAEPLYPDTVEGLCQRIRQMIFERQAQLLSSTHQVREIMAEVDELKKILQLVRRAYAKAVPDWRDDSLKKG